jgi:hypothetical protein
MMEHNKDNLRKRYLSKSKTTMGAAVTTQNYAATPPSLGGIAASVDTTPRTSQGTERESNTLYGNAVSLGRH